MNKDSFSTYHPVLNLFYFVFVLAVNMFLMHPVFLIVSILGGTIYGTRLNGVKKACRNFFCFSVPVMVIVALINPMFNHYGVTILFYLQNGNPVTLESMVYGVAMAAMLCGVMANFRCVNAVMTSDKIIYLFGRVIPAISLILSMVLRFVPEFKHRANVISQGQKGIGRDLQNGNLLQKIKHGITILSILITWSLENAINTADSMKSRGYGLPGRSAFSIYHFDKRDARILIVMLILSICFIAGWAGGLVYVDYDPKIVISGWPISAPGILMYLDYTLFCFCPVILDVAENIKWKKLQAQTGNQANANWRVFETE